MDQAQHYDSILEDYEQHYYDEPSMQYRRRYIYPRLFGSLDYTPSRILELACGSGYNTAECASFYPEAEIEGLDVSPRSCDAYSRNTGRKAHVFDLTAENPGFIKPADCAFIVGGLHHCVKDLPSTFRNIAHLIRPNGHLLMVEPNADFFLNSARMYWYRKDRWFQEADEAPLQHERILRLAKPNFVLEDVSFLGGPAYFLILNSLITRFPMAAKAAIAPVAFAMDNLYNRLPGSAAYPMFIARWRRVQTSP